MLLELAYIENSFSNFSRSHYLPTSLPNPVESIRGSRSLNREERIRLEGLSYFVQDVEQKVQPKELDKESTKFEFKVKPSNSTNKKSRKLNPTRKTAVRARPLFFRKGDKVIFNFQHFVSPEKVLREYIRFNIHNKSRLAKIDKQKISEALCSLHCDNQFDSDLDPYDLKLRNNSKQDNAEGRTNNGKKMSARKNKIKQNINTENARWITRPAHTWQPAKRISATNNIVYEFNPFGNVESNDTLKGSNHSKNSMNTCGLVKGLKVSTISKSTTNVKKNIAKDTKTRSIVTLPKLNFSLNNSMNIFERNGKLTNILENQASLPCILKKPDSTKNETIVKESDKKCKMASAKLNDINRDVEKVKTNWEQFQKHHDRRKERYMFNPRMKKLYEMLESPACDKIKENVNSTNDQNILSKNSKVSKNSKIIDQRDVERIKNILFPKQDQLTILKSTTNTDSPRNKELKENILKKEKRNIVKQQSLFTEERLWNINDILNYESNLLNSHKNNSLNNKTSCKVKTEINKYLEEYTTNFDKLDTIGQKNATIKVMESQNNIQENSNKNLNYSSCVSKEDINNFEKDGIERSLYINNNNFEKNKGSANETNNIDTKSIETFDEFNEKLSKRNVFVKMGCNDLNLPKNVLDKVLQSEYLKKDLFSLYPT